MTTVAVVSEEPTLLAKPQAIIDDLRQKIRTSKHLAEDVTRALDQLSKITGGNLIGPMDMLEFIEEVVHNTPDAAFRERLLAIRLVITVNDDITLEQLRHMV